ncbi:MAG: ribosome maturation factor RimP [Gammaproteobacteria bacterium]|nr:MAG: ribosome maturation factor RimP [Gammaproteobacteria bacterium]
MSAKAKQIHSLLAATVSELGFELWGVEFIGQGKHSILRVFIEREDGIGVEDCALVSEHVSALLDVEDPISTEYTLEVSSPGADRLLFQAEHYRAYVGSVIEVRLRRPFEGRRKFKGLLAGLEGEDVVVQMDGHEYLLPLESVEKANVVPQF